MADKKTKQKTDSKQDSLYKKIVQKTSASGEFQGQTLFDLQPWEYQGSKGISLRIKVDKLGFGSQPAKSAFCNIDLGNPEIREALKEVISVAESQ